MRKINISSFSVLARDKEGSQTEVQYELKESMIELLFQPALALTSITLLKQNELAKKILNSVDELLLEEEEYSRLLKALEILTGLGKNDVEFVLRIQNAEIVEVAPIEKINNE